MPSRIIVTPQCAEIGLGFWLLQRLIVQKPASPLSRVTAKGISPIAISSRVSAPHVRGTVLDALRSSLALVSNVKLAPPARVKLLGLISDVMQSHAGEISGPVDIGSDAVVNFASLMNEAVSMLVVLVPDLFLSHSEFCLKSPKSGRMRLYIAPIAQLIYGSTQ